MTTAQSSLSPAGGPTDGYFKPVARWRLGERTWQVFAVLIALLLALPVLAVLGAIFIPTGDVWAHLVDTVLGDYVFNSLALILGVGIGTLVMGIGGAWLVSACKFPGRPIFGWALFLPMAVPAYVIAYTYAGFLDYAGPVQSGLREVFGWTSRRDYWFPPIRSLGGAIVTMTMVLYPYVYMTARAAFIEQTAGMFEASRTLGHGPWASFFKVSLPLARPSIAAGMALATMEALNDFGTVHYFAVDTFTTGIYRTWLGRGEAAAGAQLGACLMVFMVMLVLLERYSRGRARYHNTSARYRTPLRYELKGMSAALAVVLCLFPVILGFLLPAAILAGWALEEMDSWMTIEFIHLIGNSFTLAAVTALLAVVLAVLLAYGMRLSRNPVTFWAVRLSSFGYAVPGSVIAVGILLPLAWLDEQLDRTSELLLGTGTGLLLTGTIFALVYGYLTRFLSVSLGTVESGLTRVTPGMDAAARLLGEGPGGVLRRVHLPMLSASLMTAALLVFVDILKELPATLIMRPFDYDTLAVRTFELASDEMLRQAAAPALMIVGVGILPVLLVNRALNREPRV